MMKVILNTNRVLGSMVMLMMMMLLVQPSVEAASVGPGSFRIEFQEGDLLFQAREAPLGMILDGLYQEFSVIIHGLEKRISEPITFAMRGQTLQKILEALLRHMGERNYAFEFADDRLRFVSIVPEAKAAKAPFPLPANAVPPPEAGHNQAVGAIEILEVIEGSQAWHLGLQTGDLILAYDGVTLTRASDLVERTRTTAPHETVEMIISREETPFKYFVNGGFIGVRIKTVLLTKDWVDN
jgi:hypothetical protein